ncbi:MAG: RNA-binding S4 domain-containing protein [Paludibacteraceae bacterium]|nr:RNA-binding S4 domain-containing protein [Paludibacteraceae bacterium]
MQQIQFTLREGEDFIPLMSLLKAAGAADTGGEAGQMIVQGDVKRNGQTETRKRAKIVHGDKVQIGQVTISVLADSHNG